MPASYTYDPDKNYAYVYPTGVVYFEDMAKTLNGLCQDSSITNGVVNIVDLNGLTDFALAHDEAESAHAEFARYATMKQVKAHIIIVYDAYHQGIAEMMKKVIGEALQCYVVESLDKAEELADSINNS